MYDMLVLYFLISFCQKLSQVAQHFFVTSITKRSKTLVMQAKVVKGATSFPRSSPIPPYGARGKRDNRQMQFLRLKYACTQLNSAANLHHHHFHLYSMYVALPSNKKYNYIHLQGVNKSNTCIMFCLLTEMKHQIQLLIQHVSIIRNKNGPNRVVVYL